MDIQEKEWGSFVEYLKTKGVIKIGRNSLGVITNLVREGGCTLGYNDLELMWETWRDAKAQAVPESRTDFEIIEQTLDLVDLIAHANRFQRDKTKPLPFESENPRNIEWWRLACQIQELLTDTDPNNCDFEEYKAMIAAQEPTND